MRDGPWIAAGRRTRLWLPTGQTRPSRDQTGEQSSCDRSVARRVDRSVQPQSTPSRPPVDPQSTLSPPSVDGAETHDLARPRLGDLIDVVVLDHGDDRVAAGHRVVGAEEIGRPDAGPGPHRAASAPTSARRRRARAGAAGRRRAVRRPGRRHCHPPARLAEPLDLAVGEPVVARARAGHPAPARRPGRVAAPRRPRGARPARGRPQPVALLQRVGAQPGQGVGRARPSTAGTSRPPRTAR